MIRLERKFYEFVDWVERIGTRRPFLGTCIAIAFFATVALLAAFGLGGIIYGTFYVLNALFGGIWAILIMLGMLAALVLVLWAFDEDVFGFYKLNEEFKTKSPPS